MVLTPAEVSFGGRAWANVQVVTIEQGAAKLVEEWSDAGPVAAFIDVPEQRVILKIEQSLSEEDPGEALLGEEAEVEATFGPSGGDLLRRRVRVRAVVVQVVHKVSTSGATRVVTLRGVSADGVTDPVVVESV